MGQPGKWSSASNAVLGELRAVCARLPEVAEEGDSFGHRSFRVAKKPFAILGEHEGAPALAIKTDPITQARLIKEGGFFRTPYVGQHGWVSVAEDAKPDWDQLTELITDAYRRVAPKRLQRLLDPE